MSVTLVSIDGGKSSTRLRVADQDNTEIWRGEGPGFHYSPTDGIADAILQNISHVLSSLGKPPGLTTSDEVRVCAALTGLPGDPEERGRLSTGLAQLFGSAPVLVDDVVAAHAGALAGPGTVVSAGTGTAVLAISPHGTAARVDGWGPLIGDRGSAHDIGRAALRAAACAHDGTGPATSLVGPVFDALGGTDLNALQRFYQRSQLTANIAGLAALVVQEADQGDPVSGRICEAAAEDLATSTIAAARAAFTDPSGSIASWSGRLLNLGASLTDPFTSRLEQAGIEVRPPQADGSVGAARLLVGGTRNLYAAAVQSAGAPPC